MCKYTFCTFPSRDTVTSQLIQAELDKGFIERSQSVAIPLPVHVNPPVGWRLTSCFIDVGIGVTPITEVPLLNLLRMASILFSA